MLRQEVQIVMRFTLFMIMAVSRQLVPGCDPLYHIGGAVSVRSEEPNLTLCPAPSH